jgi:hypothetical protein
MALTPDLIRRFTFHPVTDPARGKAHEDVRATILEVADHFDDVLPAGREKSLAITHLEEAMFWANAAIARDGR